MPATASQPVTESEILGLCADRIWRALNAFGEDPSYLTAMLENCPKPKK